MWDVGCGMCDVGCEVWNMDVGCGRWDVGIIVGYKRTYMVWLVWLLSAV